MRRTVSRPETIELLRSIEVCCDWASLSWQQEALIKAYVMKRITDSRPTFWLLMGETDHFALGDVTH